MRPLLMLFVGTRGVRVADTCRPLLRLADVVVMTSQDILDQRPDELDQMAAVPDVQVAGSRDAILAHALRYAAATPVHGALSFSEDLVGVCAEFTTQRGLPGQPAATMPQFLDKYRQRRALAAAGVPVPPHAVLTGPDQVAAALTAVPLPAILKPTRGSGGALAYVIEEPDQLEGVLGEARAQAPRAGGAVASDTELILESLLVGQGWHPVPGFAPYVSVESVASAGSYHHLAVTDRFPLSPPALETGMMLPSCLRADQQRAVVSMAGRALAALGFRHGLAHTELMLTADGPRVIEVNARVGGALPYLFPMVSDVDLVEQAGRVALGLQPAQRATFRGHAVFVAPQHPVGVQVARVGGLDEVRALPGVRAVIPLSAGAARTDGFRNTMIAAVLGTAGDPGEAVRLWAEVMRTVRPEYLPGVVAGHHRRTPASTASGGVTYAVPAL